MVLGSAAGPSHLRAYASALEREARENAERANKRACHRKFEYQELDSYKTLTNSGRANFERFLKALDMYFELTGFRLGYMQEKLMHEITVTFLRVMYGDDLLPNLHDIEKRFEVRELRDVTAILYPRRAGKTKTETIAGGCIVVSQPIGNCSCYNIGSRQARDWLQEAYDVMCVFKGTPEFGWELDKANGKEFIQIRTVFVGHPVACAAVMAGTFVANLFRSSSSNGLKTPRRADPETPRSAPPLSHAVNTARGVIIEAFSRYGRQPGQLAVAFSGGKDSIALLALVRHYLFEERSNRDGPLPVVAFFDTGSADTVATEVRAFVQSVQDMADYVRFHVVSIQCATIKEGLEALIDTFPGLQAVFVGTRRSDPSGAGFAGPFVTASPGWPPVTRIVPLLEWSYAHVWEYIDAHRLPYPRLYARGYTSTGGATHLNAPSPQLKRGDGTYAHARTLSDTSSERYARDKA